MTKQEFIDDCIPFEEWKAIYQNNIDNTFEEMKKYFDVEEFIKKYCLTNRPHEMICNTNIMRSILYIAFMDYNLSPYERDEFIAKMLVIPIEEVMEFELCEEFD